MEVSNTLIEAVKAFEGCRFYAYRDSAGKATIGYGHTGKDVAMGETITQKQADAYLLQDLQAAARQVDSLGLKLTQGQADALTDFVFNLGIGNMRQSTLLKKIRQGASTAAIQAEFRRWVYAGHRRLSGLVKRREWEAQRWAAAGQSSGN